MELTVGEVRAIVPKLKATDAAIQLHIDIVCCKIGECLDANYADCPELAQAIAIYTVAYFADKGNSNTGKVTSQKWADGDAITHANSDNSSEYWNTAIQLDSANCVVNAFRTSKTFAVTGRAVTCNDGPV